MAYVALKPCRFAGQQFRIGESIPEGYVLPGAARNLIQMGRIAKQNGEAAAQTQPAGGEDEQIITINVQVEEGLLLIDVTQAGLQGVFDVLTANVADAEPIIDTMTDSDALLLLFVSDQRKGIKAAAEARAKALNPESAGEG